MGYKMSLKPVTSKIYYAVEVWSGQNKMGGLVLRKLTLLLEQDVYTTIK